MTYKEFMWWCNDRAADGCWGIETCIRCLVIIEKVKKEPFWRRKKKWRECEQYVVEHLVNPTNEKIQEVFGNGGAEDA